MTSIVLDGDLLRKGSVGLVSESELSVLVDSPSEYLFERGSANGVFEAAAHFHDFFVVVCEITQFLGRCSGLVVSEAKFSELVLSVGEENSVLAEQQAETDSSRNLLNGQFIQQNFGRLVKFLLSSNTGPFEYVT